MNKGKFLAQRLALKSAKDLAGAVAASEMFSNTLAGVSITSCQLYREAVDPGEESLAGLQ